MSTSIPNLLGRGARDIDQLGALFAAVLVDLTALKAAVEAVPAAIKTAVVNGATADTNIAISGIAPTDQVLQVLHFTSGALTADLTSEASITEAGNIQLSDTDTSGDTLVVVWYDKPTAVTLTLTS